MEVVNNVNDLHRLFIDLDNNIQVDLQNYDLNAIINGLNSINDNTRMALSNMNNLINRLPVRLDSVYNYYTIQDFHTVISSLTTTFHNGIMYLLNITVELGRIEGSRDIIQILSNIGEHIVNTGSLLLRLVRRFEAGMSHGHIPDIQILPLMIFFEIWNITYTTLWNRELDRLRRR
jgi:hypothetical protein